VGWKLPADFGDPLIRSGGVTSPPVGWDPRKTYSVYLFAFVDRRAVGRDIFLDGNTFTDSHSVTHKTFVGDLSFGAPVISGSLR
jgi:lipid A 3-O-deacylase